jgi:hypothetical protein
MNLENFIRIVAEKFNIDPVREMEQLIIQMR